MLLGRIANLLARRPYLNAATSFFWLLLVLMVGFITYTFFDERITLKGHRIIGQATVALIPALAVAFFSGRRFRAKAKGHALKNQVPPNV